MADQNLGEPKRSWLRRIIESGPEGRRQAADAVAWMLGTTLVSISAIGGLLIWHLIRRGRILRDRLDAPKLVRMPDPEEILREPNDSDAAPKNRRDVPPT